MSITTIVLLSAVSVAIITAFTLYRLLHLQRIAYIETIGYLNPPMKYAKVVISTGILNRRIQRIACYQRPWSTRWFRCDNHHAISLKVNNLLNRQARTLLRGS